MIKQLLEEVRAAPLDEAGRQRLREIHDLSIHELEEGLAPELRDELERFTLPFGDSVPSEAELRIAQAQLVGWLEGLFHGIQTALFAQQMAARAQLEEMRRRAQRSIGPSFGMSPTATTSAAPRPCDSATSASPLAFVTPAPAISSRPCRDEWVTVARPSSSVRTDAMNSSGSRSRSLASSLT